MATWHVNIEATSTRINDQARAGAITCVSVVLPVCRAPHPKDAREYYVSVSFPATCRGTEDTANTPRTVSSSFPVWAPAKDRLQRSPCQLWRVAASSDRFRGQQSRDRFEAGLVSWQTVSFSDSKNSFQNFCSDAVRQGIRASDNCTPPRPHTPPRLPRPSLQRARYSPVLHSQ